jgi:two-component system CheB/CheR fusion protein
LAPQPATATSEDGPAPQLARRLRMLVVDDNIEAADSLSKLLRRESHQAWSAYDGPSALELFGKCRPDVVVLDLGLPGMDGYEVAKQLRGQASTSDLLLIALSGYGQEEDRRRSFAAGFDHHFNKPLDYPRLLQTLAAAFPAGRDAATLSAVAR